MSIIDLSKIGERIRQNQADIAIVLGFILVALISFGAGYLVSPGGEKSPVVIEESNNLINAEIVSQPSGGSAGESAVLGQTLNSTKGVFVASRGGTKYHWPWCSWGQRIKDENKIWFNSEAEAQQAGYSPCACIQNKAPAGLSKE